MEVVDGLERDDDHSDRDDHDDHQSEHSDQDQGQGDHEEGKFSALHLLVLVHTNVNLSSRHLTDEFAIMLYIPSGMGFGSTNGSI